MASQIPGVDQPTIRRATGQLPASTIDEAILRQCRCTPDRAAVSFDGDEWSYANLERFINRIAAAVASRTDQANPLIGVCLHRSNEMVGCLLGVMAAGGAYLPLEPDLPPARLALILEDAAPALIIGTACSLSTLPQSGVPTLLLDEVPSIYAAPIGSGPKRRSGRDLA